MSEVRGQFVVCVRNDDHRASLEPRKIYRVVADPRALEHGLVRIVDESGEDYLYPAAYFVPIVLSRELTEALAAG